MTTTSTTPKITHAPACPGTRSLDVTTHAEEGITTAHCVECGAHEARREDGQIITPPAMPGPFNLDDKPGLFDGITLERATNNPKGHTNA